MKTYPESLLEIPNEAGAATLPTTGVVTACFPAYREFALGEFRWISRTIKQIKQSDDEDVLDHVYRRGHVVSGLAHVLGIPRVPRLLSILDLVLDLARDTGGFESHSMGYLVELLVDTSASLLDELGTKGSTSLEIADVVSECRTYLTQPLAERNAPPPVQEAPAPEPIPTEADEPAAPGPVVDAAPAVPAPAVVYDDSPEALDVPVDKVTFLSDFCEEARESLGNVGRKLIELETSATPTEIVNELFRGVHTVKGGARLLKIGKIEAVSHAMESILDQVRKGSRQVTPGTVDVLMDCTSSLGGLVDEVAAGGPLTTRIQPLLTALDAVARGATPPASAKAAPVAPAASDAAKAGEAAAQAPVPAGGQPPAKEGAAKGPSAMGGESIRVPTEKLDEVLNTASEIFIGRIRLQSELAALDGAILQFKKAMPQMAALDANTIVARLGEANARVCQELRTLMARGAGQVPQDRVESMIGRFHAELQTELNAQQVSNAEEITLNVLSIEEIRKRFQKNIERLEQLSTRLQSGAMSFRMLPISHLFDRFPAQVREVARQVGKKVRLEVSGGDTELDKVLINKLGDPLIHIMRNAVDHGVEDAEGRRAAGKPEVGRITLRAYYQGSHAVIEISDDGRGIDQKRVLDKAVSVGLVSAERAATITGPEILELIFEPGFSTAGKVSELSGRGVGMDVVKTAVNQVQGSVAIESTLGAGTSIRIKLPLTLAVVGILLVEERSNQFAFPILNVEEVLMVDRAQVRHVSGATVYNHRGRTMPVTTLSKLLDFPSGSFSEPLLPLVILTDGDKRTGIIVDSVLGKQDVLIKNLGSLVRHVPFVMGCTILSDSRLVLILNAWEVVNKAMKKTVADLTVRSGRLSKRKDFVVLVVDDSAIQRKNLSSIISQAGYRVESAENGFEGVKLVRRRQYSVYCVDVIMPLMDGFEFVERLRRTPGNADAPVFFITARTARTDRDRAAGFGAVEYFNKPVDAGLLVETLDRYCLGSESTELVEAEGKGARV